MADVQVIPVPRGSIVLLKNLRLPEHPRDREMMMESLRDGIGHAEFAVLHSMDGLSSVEVLSDPEEFPEWMARKIAEQAVEEALVTHTPRIPDRPSMRLPAGQVNRRAVRGQDVPEGGVDFSLGPDGTVRVQESESDQAE